MIRKCTIALIVALLGACGTTGPVPVDSFYRLPEIDAQVDDPFGAALVRVSIFDATDLHRDRAIVFGDSAGIELQRHNYHFWVDGPPNLLQLSLAGFLRDASPLATVVTRAVARPDFEIDGRIAAFERLLGDSGTRVNVALQLTLRRPGGEIVLTREYRETISVASDRMMDSIAAFATALQRIFTQFAVDLTQSLARA
jgi:ABC-type uncharacterized transport system auxiliary subunit